MEPVVSRLNQSQRLPAPCSDAREPPHVIIIVFGDREMQASRVVVLFAYWKCKREKRKHSARAWGGMASLPDDNQAKRPPLPTSGEEARASASKLLNLMEGFPGLSIPSQVMGVSHVGTPATL